MQVMSVKRTKKGVTVIRQRQNGAFWEDVILKECPDPPDPEFNTAMEQFRVVESM